MPTPEILLQDNFADNKHGWNVGKINGGDTEIIAGALVMTLTKSNWSYWVTSDVSNSDVDFTVEAEALATTAHKASIDYGTVCRSGPMGEYHFALYDDGSYDIHRFYSNSVLFTGGRLVYLFQPTGTKGYQLVSAQSDGTDLVNLTDNRQGHVLDFSVSPDGHKIVYAWKPAQAGRIELRTISSDGSGEATLLPSDATDYVSIPAWSPDGQQIAYVVSHGSGNNLASDIFVMQADGSNSKPLTNSGFALMPSWSPDGHKMAYIWWDNLHNPQIHVMNADGSQDVNLTPDAPAAAIEPYTQLAWSPDGQKIAFTSKRDGNDGIYVMNSDGSETTRLTFDPNAAMSPSWTPDGKFILFSSDRGGAPYHLRLYIMNADGSGTRALASGNGDSDMPRLLP